MTFANLGLAIIAARLTAADVAEGLGLYPVSEKRIRKALATA